MRADAAANRAAIVAAARDLLAGQGLDVPMSTIADRAGVGIATLYRNFPDRTALLLGIAHDVLDQVLATVETYRPLVVADPEQGWPSFVRALADLRLGAALPNVVRAVTANELAAPGRAVRDRAFAALDTVLTPARDAGLVRADVSPVLLHLGLAVITRPLPESLPADLPELTDWLVATFLRGLRP